MLVGGRGGTVRGVNCFKERKREGLNEGEAKKVAAREKLQPTEGKIEVNR